MSESTGDDSRQVSQETARKLLERASLLEVDTADDLTLEELRAAAVEAGLSPEAMDTAIAELLDQSPELQRQTSTVEAPGSLIASLAYGSLGTLLGTVAEAGNGTWAEVVLVLSVVATFQLLARHSGSRRLGPLIREATILWAAYSAAWVVGGGDPWPHLFALPLLALVLTALGGFLGGVLTSGEQETSSGELPSQPTLNPKLSDGVEE